MSEEFSPNIVVLTDEDGNDLEFEHLDTIEFEGDLYMAFAPAGIPDDYEDAIELTILQVTKDENGDEILASVDDEEKLQAVFEVFMEDAEDEE